jgi:hypothetical protein
MRKAFIATVIVFLILVGTSLQSYANENEIYGCYGKVTGKLRIVSDTSDCKQLENPIQWSVQGPQGDQGPSGPEGSQGPPGPQGDPGISGAGGKLPYVFVGYTSSKVNGGAGIIGMTTLCQNEFGTDSRWCTSKEFMNSVDFSNFTPPTDVSLAWIRPVFVGYSENIALDASGVSGTGRTLTCNGWRNVSSPSAGLGVLPETGGFMIDNCFNEYPVTCCAPSQ